MRLTQSKIFVDKYPRLESIYFQRDKQTINIGLSETRKMGEGPSKKQLRKNSEENIAQTLYTSQ